MMNLTYNYVSDLPRFLEKEARQQKAFEEMEALIEEYRQHHRRESLLRLTSNTL